MTFRRSSTALITSVAIAFAMLATLLSSSLQREDASAQSVSWLSDSSVSYLTSSGITVYVPSWVPGPFSGSSPEIYAGSGSYSIYFVSGTAFLYVTGEYGAGFPGGSEADLNVPLSINTSVLGYPAIQDIGIPAGSTTPIYDKVMWIAGGVLYTVWGNGLDTDSLTLANSSVALSEPAPNTGGDTSSGDQSSSSGDAGSTSSGTSSSSNTSSSSSEPASTSNTDSSSSSTSPTPTVLSDGTDGARFIDDAGDGTGGPRPPILQDDGTGGA